MKRLTDNEVQVLTGYVGAILNSDSNGAVQATDRGLPIDTMGFKDILATLAIGNVGGTAGQVVDVDAWLEESATIDGTTTAWVRIGDGAINGSANFTSTAVTVGTTNVVAQRKIYEKLDDTNRKRYIRAVGAVKSTGGSVASLAVSIILANPDNTIYINQSTGAAITDTYAGNMYKTANLYGTFQA